MNKDGLTVDKKGKLDLEIDNPNKDKNVNEKDYKQ